MTQRRDVEIRIQPSCIVSETCTDRFEMARRGVQLERESFSCSICLEPLTDPVTIPCGHSYCLLCLRVYWGEEEEGKLDRCPQCRNTFTPRPTLMKNTMLADLMERLKRSASQAVPAEQPHSSATPQKKLKRVDPSYKQGNNVCPHHGQVMEMFCLTDQQCICSICAVYEHRDHNIVSAGTERAGRQLKLQASQLAIQQRMQDAQRDVDLLEQQAEAIDGSADATVENCKEIFRQQILLIQERSSAVEQQIRSSQQTEVSRTRELQEKLQQEVTLLKKKDSQLVQLTRTEDHIEFLLNYPTVAALSQPTQPSGIQLADLSYFEGVTTAVLAASHKVQDVLRETPTHVPVRVTEVETFQSQPEPTTRDEFIKYSCEITLDPNTAHTDVELSEGNTKARNWPHDQSRQNHPDRFTDYYQVLSKDGLTGRCYWEVEFESEVSIAVSYKNISRVGSGNECGFGYNDKSCALQCYLGTYKFWHNNVVTPVSGPYSNRVGVFLDHTAGTLAFYSVSKTMTLLHRGQTTFTQPLYVGLWLSDICSSAHVLSSVTSNKLRSLQL